MHQCSTPPRHHNAGVVALESEVRDASTAELLSQLQSMADAPAPVWPLIEPRWRAICRALRGRGNRREVAA